MLWARLERRQSCVARRQLEQQRQQRAVCESEQQHADERQQQHWLSLREGDSEGGGQECPRSYGGRSAPVHGLPRSPERKPTGRGLFRAPERETNKQNVRGLVATAPASVNAPAFFNCSGARTFLSARFPRFSPTLRFSRV